MSNAYFLQKLETYSVSSRATAGTGNVKIGSLRLPPGDYIILAKFEVAVSASADNDLRPRISQFSLQFAGHWDKAWCHLNEGGLDTVVLTIAGSHTADAELVVRGGAPLWTTALLVCEETSDDLEIKHLAMSASSVDSIDWQT